MFALLSACDFFRLESRAAFCTGRISTATKSYRPILMSVFANLNPYELLIRFHSSERNIGPNKKGTWK